MYTGLNIINADDFGKSSSVNIAVLHCFTNHWISSATIMANMPGFEEACQIAHEHKLTDYIGIHVVLSEGKPLTDAIKREIRFCNSDGFFRPRPKNQKFFSLNKREKSAVTSEIVAQIEKCRRAGLPLSHLDSHHHFHEEWGIMEAILPLVRQFQIPNVRIMRNISDSCSIHRKLYAAFFNARLRRRKLGRTKLFGSIYDYLVYSQRVRSTTRKNSCEIMIHPMLNNNGRIVDGKAGTSLEYLLELALKADLFT
ncbi:MAG: ChbG/HpnK family deacetylase [Sedimentisphaerales bacterium]|nr:ChbG/HpnK family deacetylase [Sedimentisphaerales bacterium]